jgi:hypothetical protein
MPLPSCLFSRRSGSLAAGLVLLCLCSGLRGAETTPAPPPQPGREECIQRLTAELAPRLARARYMEANPEPVSVPGWEGYPTRQYRYSVKDRTNGATKSASVIMLNPDARQLARWIVTACLEAKGAADERDTRKLADHIIAQSGAQFPVRGIVFEDILPHNGIYEIYCFRDGVTVKISGVDHRGETPPSAAQLDRALHAPLSEVTWVGAYARIQSATREDYQRAGGQEPVAGAGWLEVSRTLYQRAWGADRNELMIAWAKANLR